MYIKSPVNISHYLHLFLRTEPHVQRLRGFNRCAKLCTNIRGQLKVGLFPTRKQPDAANNLYMSVVPVGLGGLRVRALCPFASVQLPADMQVVQLLETPPHFDLQLGICIA